MTTQIGALWTLLGLAALAGLFFALQRLRVRQRTLTVETTLFWRQAIEEARARVFVERFRHPWVYALLLLIAALLWLGFARLSFGLSRDTQHVVLIDGSAMSGRGDRLAQTLDLVEALAADLEPALRSVLWCGGTTRTLLAPGEHARLLRERTAGLMSEAVPPSIEAALSAQLRKGRRGASLRVYIAGDASLDKELLDALPDEVSVRRLAPSGDAPDGNRGISALGAGLARSGVRDRVDVLVEVSSEDGKALAPEVTLDGRASTLRFEAMATKQHRGGSTRSFILRDVPAQGQLLELRLPGSDELPADNAASLVLPDRRPLRVALEPSLPAILRQVIEADPELVIDAQNPQLAVRAEAGSGGDLAKLPALCFVDGQAGDAFAFSLAPGGDAQRTLEHLHRRLGLAEIDASQLARQTGRRISLSVTEAEQRRVTVWRSLLSSDYNFVQSRSFPLFVSMSLRWLAQRWTPPESLAVSEAIDLDWAKVREPDGGSVETLGDAFHATRVGVHTNEEGARFAANLLSSPVSLGADSDPVERLDRGLGGPDAVTWLLLLALLLLAFEWVLYGRGRLP